MSRWMLLSLSGCWYISEAERNARWDLDGDGSRRPFDCNDDDPTISPNHAERCDPQNIDEDCDGRSDDLDDSVEGPLSTFCLDTDGDGIGELSSAVERCDPPNPIEGAWVSECEDLPSETTGCSELPEAVFSLSPAVGVRGESVFTADASASRGDGLQYRVSWGSLPGASSFDPVAQSTLDESGWIDVTLEVTDRCNRSAWATSAIAVSEPGQLLVVTTPLDESDPESFPSPSGWLGEGLSLREAILIASGASARQVIGFTDGLGPIRTTLDFPELQGDGDILSGPGVTLDGSSGGLLAIKGDGAIVAGLVLDGFIESNNGALQLAGVASAAYGVTVQNSVVGIEIDGSGARIEGGIIVGSSDNQLNIRAPSTLHKLVVADGGGPGITIEKASGTVLSMCQIYGNNGDGIRIREDVAEASILDSTIVGNGGNGIEIDDIWFGALSLSNTAIAFNDRYGVQGLADNFAPGSPSHNLWFGNGNGDCSGCSDLGTGSIVADPRFANLAAWDLNPLPDSPLIDAGNPQTAIDRNGPAPDHYFGAGPDIGAIESQADSTGESTGG